MKSFLNRTYSFSLRGVFFLTVLFFLSCVPLLFLASDSPEAQGYDFVDNNISNVDGVPDIGTHSNFTAQQYGPDSVYDTLTEENTGGGATWSNNTQPSALILETDPDISGSAAKHEIYGLNNLASDDSTYGGGDIQDCGTVNDPQEISLTMEFDYSGLGISGSDISYLKFEAEVYFIGGTGRAPTNDPWEMVNTLYNGSVDIYNWDSGSWEIMGTVFIDDPNDLSIWDNTDDVNPERPLVRSKDSGFSSNHMNSSGYIRIRIQMTGVFQGTRYDGCSVIDYVDVDLQYGEENYELDLEVQWTNANYTQTYEELCIYRGIMGSENIRVDVWNSSTWHNLFTDLSGGWNNVSITDYLVSSTFTISFKGGTETGDTSQDSWEIDCTLLHTWGVAPIANFSYTPEYPYTGETVTFNASDSYDPDGSIVSYFWDFGDRINGTDVVTTHSYADDGTYTVVLTVTDNDELSDTTSADVTVLNRPGFAIITHPDFENTGIAWSLERLRDWHNENDTLLTYIINTTTILSDPTYFVDGPFGDDNVSNPYWRSEEDAITDLSMFNDTQARLRNYIRYAHHKLNVRYVLLVGDEDKIPTRKLTADGYGAPACGGTTAYYGNIPTNMYYACLDGTFNDDEDSNNDLHEVVGWGENATYNGDHNIDEVDWYYEVAVGRITPDNNEELGNIIRKTIAYMELSGDEDYLIRTVLAGQYAGFDGDADWGVNYSKQLNNATCSDWNHLTHGFNSSIYEFTYLDPNPDRPEEHIDYTDENVKSIFDEGVHLWYQCGHGSPSKWSNYGGYGDSWDTFDVTTLENNFYPLVYASIPCLSGRWDDTDCLSEEFVNDDHGAFASIMNSRYGWGSYNDLHSTSHYIGREFFDAYFHESYVRVGDMLFDAFKDSSWLRDQNDGTIRWACFDQNIIGNPAVQMKFPTSLQKKNDVAVNSVTTEKEIVYQGYLLPINVTVKNQGYCTETFSVTVYAHTTVIGTQTVYSLAPGSQTIVTFTWNTTGVDKGDYTISAKASEVPGETETADNTKVDGTVTVLSPGHDVAIKNVTPSKTVVGQNYSLSISITAKNYGSFLETFNITGYYNETAITLPNGKNYTTMTLSSGSSTTVTLTWNTTGVPYGNYTIRAVADTVDGETETADNSKDDGTVLVSIVGDVNGNRKVDVFDAVITINAVPSVPGWPNWNPNADIDCNGKVDVFDAVICIGNIPSGPW